MDTQRGKNRGYPGNAKKGKKEHLERQTKRQRQAHQHPEQSDKQDSPQFPTVSSYNTLSFHLRHVFL